MNNIKRGTKGNGDVYQWTQAEVNGFNEASAVSDNEHTEVRLHRYGDKVQPMSYNKRVRHRMWYVKLYSGAYLTGGCEYSGYVYNSMEQDTAVEFHQREAAEKVLTRQTRAHLVEVAF